VVLDYTKHYLQKGLNMESAVPILVAFIAGVVSLIGLVISKENKISEFRQAWIDELRKDISDYISYTDKHAFYYKLTRANDKRSGGSGGLQKDGIDLYLNEYHIVYSLYSRIKLRISVKEDHKDSNKDQRLIEEEVIEALEEVKKCYDEAAYNPNAADTKMSLYHAVLLGKSQILLKKEWERVKKGEKWFRNAKWAVAFIVVMLMLFIVYTVVSSNSGNL
jgi:hypothetical protein